MRDGTAVNCANLLDYRMDTLLFPVKLLLVLGFIAGGIFVGFLPLFSLVSAITTPGDVWRTAGRSKPRWVLALFVFLTFAAVPYWFIVRPHLERTAGRRPYVLIGALS